MPATTSSETIISVEALTRRYKAREALRNISLAVPRNQWLALLGPNASGKSTLLRILATLDTPTQGRASILSTTIPGAPRRELAAARARLAVVFQSPGLDPLLTPRENLRNQAALFAILRREADHRIDRLAADFNLTPRLDDRTATLSGGLIRRVDLARALVSEPELLLHDEPTTGLDLEARAAFLDALASRRAASPLTIIMNTHAMDEAERADRVVMLDQGAIVADGAPADLRADMGDNVLRLAPHHRDHLANHNLQLLEQHRALIASGAHDQIQSAAANLARRNIPFEFGPPTLADVFLARTGRALTAEPDPAELEERAA
ncbi:MAG: ABC transporter ATP-binding protein, partial [Planctomycetota bacterium]|nr:ABC transporter ATP-binding protein [Planctomycetota bacterium]